MDPFSMLHDTLIGSQDDQQQQQQRPSTTGTSSGDPNDNSKYDDNNYNDDDDDMPREQTDALDDIALTTSRFVFSNDDVDDDDAEEIDKDRPQMKTSRRRSVVIEDPVSAPVNVAAVNNNNNNNNNSGNNTSASNNSNNSNNTSRRNSGLFGEDAMRVMSTFLLDPALQRYAKASLSSKKSMGKNGRRRTSVRGNDIAEARNNAWFTVLAALRFVQRGDAEIRRDRAEKNMFFMGIPIIRRWLILHRHRKIIASVQDKFPVPTPTAIRAVDSILNHFPDRQIARLLEEGKPRPTVFDEGQALMYLKEPSTFFYILVDGDVEIVGAKSLEKSSSVVVNTVSGLAVIGLLGVVTNEHRIATVRARNRCFGYLIRKQEFDTFCDGVRASIIHDARVSAARLHESNLPALEPLTTTHLRQFPLLNFLSDAQLQRLVAVARPRCFVENDVILDPKQSARSVFVVVRGTVLVKRSSGSDDAGDGEDNPLLLVSPRTSLRIVPTTTTTNSKAPSIASPPSQRRLLGETTHHGSQQHMHHHQSLRAGSSRTFAPSVTHTVRNDGDGESLPDINDDSVVYGEARLRRATFTAMLATGEATAVLSAPALLGHQATMAPCRRHPLTLAVNDYCDTYEIRKDDLMDVLLEDPKLLTRMEDFVNQEHAKKLPRIPRRNLFPLIESLFHPNHAEKVQDKIGALHRVLTPRMYTRTESLTEKGQAAKEVIFIVTGFARSPSVPDDLTTGAVIGHTFEVTLAKTYWETIRARTHVGAWVCGAAEWASFIRGLPQDVQNSYLTRQRRAFEDVTRRKYMPTPPPGQDTGASPHPHQQSGDDSTHHPRGRRSRSNRNTQHKNITIKKGANNNNKKEEPTSQEEATTTAACSPALLAPQQRSAAVPTPPSSGGVGVAMSRRVSIVIDQQEEQEGGCNGATEDNNNNDDDEEESLRLPSPALKSLASNNTGGGSFRGVLKAPPQTTAESDDDDNGDGHNGAKTFVVSPHFRVFGKPKKLPKPVRPPPPDRGPTIDIKQIIAHRPRECVTTNDYNHPQQQQQPPSPPLPSVLTHYVQKDAEKDTCFARHRQNLITALPMLLQSSSSLHTARSPAVTFKKPSPPPLPRLGVAGKKNNNHNSSPKSVPPLSPTSPSPPSTTTTTTTNNNKLATTAPPLFASSRRTFTMNLESRHANTARHATTKHVSKKIKTTTTSP
eukprot:PhM_4_TR9182/c0_g2_i1/m.67718